MELEITPSIETVATAPVAQGQLWTVYNELSNVNATYNRGYISRSIHTKTAGMDGQQISLSHLKLPHSVASPNDVLN